jgi:hypothetical protein
MLTEIWKEGVDYIYFCWDKDEVARSYEHGNEPPGSIRCGEFLD